MLGWRVAECEPPPRMRTKLILTGILAIAVAGSYGTVAKAHPISFAAQPALTVASESHFLVLAKSGKHGKRHKWRGKWARHRGGWHYSYPVLAYPVLAYPHGLPPGFIIPDAPEPRVHTPPAAVPSVPPAVEPAPLASQAPQAAVRPIPPPATPAPSPPIPSPTPQAAAPPTTEAEASAGSHWGSRNSGPLTPLAPLSPRPKRSPQNQTASPAKPNIQWQNPEKRSE